MKKTILIILAALALVAPLRAQQPRVVSSSAYEICHTISMAGGHVLAVSGYNSKGSAQFIQIHDRAGDPSAVAAEVSTCNLGTRTAGQLANKYFTISSPTVDYYVWFNLDSGGADPAVAGKTGIEVAITTGDSTATMATAAAAAIDALAAFVSTATSTTITITNAVTGTATDIGVGTLTTGVTVAVTTQGVSPAVPVAVITVPATSNFSFTLPDVGLPMSTGVWVCNSSTAATYTAGSADCFFTVIYK